MPKAHPTSELAKIFFEFGYYDAMHNVPFKPRAYQMASESMEGLGGDVQATWKRGGVKALKELPGIGQALADKIDEYFRTGHIKEYEAMKKKFPVDIWGLARIEGLGPKKIFDLYKTLKVKNVADLQRVLKTKKVASIPHFGKQSAERLSRGVGLMKEASERRILAYVEPLANRIVAKLASVPGVKHCSYAGSLRRKQETIGDIDLIATLEHSTMTAKGTEDAKRIMETFVHLPQVVSVHEQGKTRASVRLKNGMDADLRVVPDEVYGATLQYFTGDKRHNVLLREHALSKGFTLNEYGLFKLGRKTAATKTARAHGKLIACDTEEAVYHALGMDTPPPEIRTGTDEIEAARLHRLPNLLPYGSIKGDLQVQTDWTDGEVSIEAMVEAAKKKGLSYMAVTDHTKALAFIHGLDPSGVAKQGKAIDALNKKLRDFRVFKGTECDILKDGSLDLPDATLKTLDWVGISVHSAFRLSRAEQTKRVVDAISNPNVDCLFHPTCRLIGKREPIDLDMDEVIAAAKKHRVALEIDAFPMRSDLNDHHARMAVKAGVMLVIDTDAHAPAHFGFMPLGEAIARRGWAEKKDVLNTRSAKDLQAYLNKKRPR